MDKPKKRITATKKGPAKKKAPAKNRATWKYTAEFSKKINDLAAAGILNPYALSPKAIAAIEVLDEDQIRALKQINDKVSLGVLINPRGPQYGGP